MSSNTLNETLPSTEPSSLLRAKWKVRFAGHNRQQPALLNV